MPYNTRRRDDADTKIRDCILLGFNNKAYTKKNIQKPVVIVLQVYNIYTTHEPNPFLLSPQTRP